MFVERSAGLNRGAGSVVGPYQRQSRGSSKQFGVGCGSKQLVRVLLVNDFSGVEGDHFDSPETAGEVERRKNGINAFGDRIVFGSVQAGCQQQIRKQAKSREI